MDLLKDLAGRMGMDRVPEIVVVEGEKCATRGERILIGEDIVNGKRELLEFMLAHELSHVKNGHSRKKLILEGLCALAVLANVWAFLLYSLPLILLVLVVRRVVIEFWEIQANVEGAKAVGVRKAIEAMEDFTADYRLIDYVLEPLRRLFVKIALSLYLWLYPENRFTALRLYVRDIL